MIRNTIFKLALAAVALAIPVAAQSANEQRITASAQRISGDQFGFVTKTSKGAKVYGVKKPSKQALAAIDKGLADLFAIARKNGYSNKLNYSDYVIYIAKPDRLKSADGNYSPDIAIAAAQYAGTEYDKGGYIYAAGMMIGLNPCAFLIGEHTKEFGRMSDVVRYEGEHLVLYHNDRQRYLQTMDHSKGGQHPILQ